MWQRIVYAPSHPKPIHLPCIATCYYFFFLMIRRPPRSTLFPYTTSSDLGGQGAVALNGLMEDAATAEICRAQLWQWIAQGTPTEYGVPVTAGLVVRMLREELDVLAETGALDEDAARRFGQARTLLTVLLSERTCPEFLTLPAYLRHMSGGAAAPATAQAT